MQNKKRKKKKSLIFEDKIAKITSIENFNKEKNSKNNKNSPEKEEERKHKRIKNKKKVKTVGVKHLKIKAMSNYFKQMNIFFIIKVVIIFFLTFSYFFVLIILEDYYENILLNLDEVINEIEGVYKDGFENLILLKTMVSTEIENKINKQKAESYSDAAFDNKTDKLIDPSTINLKELKLGNSLMTILNDDGIENKLQEKLNILYNGNSCQALFLSEENNGDNITNDVNNKYYEDCTIFWSAILVKGMEQAMTQMIIEKNSVIDELTALYRTDKNITDILNKNSSLRRFEFFLLFYFLRAFWKTSNLFDEIKNIKINNINNIYIIITIAYMAITLLLILIVRHVIRKSRTIFNSFLNFIVILPAKFLSDDSYFLEEILKLEEKLY